MFPWKMLFPFHKNTGDMLNQFQTKDMEPYIEKFFSQFIPDTQKMFSENNPSYLFTPNDINNNSSSNTIHASVFQTHEHVFVRIPLKDPVNLKNIKIFHTSNQLMLDGLPGKEERETITLPSIVKKKGANAIYKENVLEICIPKSKDFQFSEIDVSEA